MAAPQEDIANLNKLIDEIMHEDVEAVEEVQSENQLEVEGTVNQVGERQDTLIHAVNLSNEISTKGKGIPSAVGREKDEIKFPKFVPSEASFDVDPPNVIPTKAYKRRKGN